MTLTDHLEDWMGVCRVERGFTTTTCKTYGSAVRRFIIWAGGDTPVEDFTERAVKRYLYHLSAEDLRPRTVRSNVISLRQFGAYLLAVGALPTNPAKTLPTPKLDAARRDCVSDAEIADLLAAARRLPNPTRAACAEGMLSVLCYSGLRRAELLALRLPDVDLAEGAIIVRQGKGQKTRTVWPHKECFAAIRAWLRVRPKAHHDYLWAFDPSRRYGDESLRKLLREVKRVAGMEEAQHIHPHAMRRGCATRLMNAGADIRAIQGFLGHASMETTAVYLASDMQRVKQIAGLGQLKPLRDAEGTESHAGAEEAPQGPQKPAQGQASNGGVSVKRARVERMQRMRNPAK